MLSPGPQNFAFLQYKGPLFDDFRYYEKKTSHLYRDHINFIFEFF